MPSAASPSYHHFYRWYVYVYHSQSWVVCGLPVPVIPVPARPVAAPCATCPKGFVGGWAGYLTMRSLVQCPMILDVSD